MSTRKDGAGPAPHQLWDEAGGDPERYRELMREHGYLLYPGDEGYEEAPRNLPCGWPHRGESSSEEGTRP